MRKQSSLSTFFSNKKEASPPKEATSSWAHAMPESQKNNFKEFAYQSSTKHGGSVGSSIDLTSDANSRLHSGSYNTNNSNTTATGTSGNNKGEEVVAPTAKKARTLPPSITKASSVPSSSSYSSYSGSTYPPSSSYNKPSNYSNAFGNNNNNNNSNNKPNNNNTNKFAYVSSFRPHGSDDTDNDPSPHKDKKKLLDNDADPSKQALLQQHYTLSTSQRQVLETIMSRKSVFFTGAAGTGKSYILKILQEIMTALDMSEKISFTAPTGVAACNIQGLTIHSWSGVGLATEPIDKLLPFVLRSRAASERWKNTDILVIDEISMMSAELLDKLDIIGRRVRNDLRPFGGIQLVLCGDFFQLPPVGLGKTCKFCFEANVWKELFLSESSAAAPNMILLEKVFRQKDDFTFLSLLNELRYGNISPQTLQVLMEKSRHDERKPSDDTAEIRPTKLFSTNQEVDKHNSQEMQLLCQQDEEDPKFFKACDDGKDPYLNQLRQGTKAPPELYLKVGAQVMLLKNLSTGRGLVNGARGTVIGFEKSNGRSEYYPYLPRVKFCVIVGKERTEEILTLPHETWEIKQGDKVLASRIQIPLCLAWAISIHKSQGMTIPFLEVSLGRIFECGQAYVALSRATSLEGLTLKHFTASCIRAHAQVKQFYAAVKATQLNSIMNNGEDGEDPQDVCDVTLKQFVEVFNPDGPEEAEVDGDAWLDAKPRDALKRSLPPPPPSQPTRNAFAPPPIRSTTTTPQDPTQSRGKAAAVMVDMTQDVVVVTPSPTSSSQLSNNSNTGSSNVPKVSTFTSARQMVVTPTSIPNPYSSSSQSSVANPAPVATETTTTITEELRKKIEESRLAALQKLELYKKRKEEETKAVMSQFNL